MYSQYKVGDIIAALGDRNAAEDIKFHVGTLKKGADRCQESIKEVEQSFDHWLAYVCELHQASVQQEDNTEEMLRANQSHLAAKQAQLSGTKEARDMAKSAVERVGKALDTAEAAFKKAADRFPSAYVPRILA